MGRRATWRSSLGRDIDLWDFSQSPPGRVLFEQYVVVRVDHTEPLPYDVYSGRAFELPEEHSTALQNLWLLNIDLEQGLWKKC